MDLVDLNQPSKLSLKAQRKLRHLRHINAFGAEVVFCFLSKDAEALERQIMTVAVTLARYLSAQGVQYDVVQHPHTVTASESAKLGKIPIDRLAKAVVLKEEDGYMLAVLPASCHIQFGDLKRQLGFDVSMASEDQIEILFRDCDPGAVPGVGAAYGLRVVIDESLIKEPEIYLEGGDHTSLLHLSGTAFARLMVDARQARFAS